MRGWDLLEPYGGVEIERVGPIVRSVAAYTLLCFVQAGQLRILWLEESFWEGQ